jgi:dimethylhistidine N-methyltransferase
MSLNSTLTLIAPERRDSWHEIHPQIWSPAAAAPREDPARSIMRTLFDQPRWLEAFHLYDAAGSELFERICELPEYYLTRTENAILERNAARIISAAPVQAIVELGAGYSKKTVHLLREQTRQRGSGIFAPIDVSLSGLVAAQEFTAAQFPQLGFFGLNALYEDGFSSIGGEIPSLFVFLGSTVGNFTPPAFIRFFNQLSRAMGPNDYLLLGADRIKDADVLERAYNDAQGITAKFILNVFENINRLTGANFEPAKMRYDSWYDPEWAQIEMYAIASASQQIEFRSFGSGFHWPAGERILVEISRKFDPQRLQQQLEFFDLRPVEHFTDPNRWFSLLLLKKNPEAAVAKRQQNDRPPFFN